MISSISVPDTQATTLTDLTDLRVGVHAVQCLVEDVEIALRNALRCRLVRRPSRRCYAPGRGEERAALALEASAQVEAGELPPHVLVSAPGLVVRPSRTPGLCDAAHELTVFRIRAGRRLTAESVDAMVHTVLPAILPEHSLRVDEFGDAEASDALRVSVTDQRGACVPVGACGILPGAAGSTASTTVVALELHLDAVLMLRKGIDDVRLLRASDPLLAVQMRDLGRFRTPGAPRY